MHGSLKSPVLFAPAVVPAPPRQPAPKQHKPQLWLAVHLPNLPFDALAPSLGAPIAVVEPLRGQIRVVAVNEQARVAGIEPGTKLTTALALERSLQVIDRSQAAERAALESLASWTQRLTPLTSLESPESLLLEVSGSLKLFGGLAPIKARLADELKARQMTSCICAAPTALGALWLARGGCEDVCLLEEMTTRVGILPLQVTRWPESVRALLRESGVRTVGDCLRLPRDGLARRVGERHLQDLDKAVGLRLDLRTFFQTPRHWQAVAEFPEEVSQLGLLADALEHMLEDLVTDLRRRQSQVPKMQLRFVHTHRPPTSETLECTAPTHERERLLNLLLDRLERIALPAPVIALRLDAGPLEAMALREPTLFEKHCAATSSLALLERLRGRFGAEGAFGIKALAEYRPECAWTHGLSLHAEKHDALPPSWIPGRPLWMLPAPLPLTSAAARRYYDGALQLQSGPERIESGWWDGSDINRDYYTAMSSGGQKLWIYRDRLDRAWRLHGLFG